MECQCKAVECGHGIDPCQRQATVRVRIFDKHFNLCGLCTVVQGQFNEEDCVEIGEPE